MWYSSYVDNSDSQAFEEEELVVRKPKTPNVKWVVAEKCHIKYYTEGVLPRMVCGVRGQSLAEKQYQVTIFQHFFSV